jgi:cation diffusion facilitator CzcD-associated flavoprotein CzcO
VSDRSDFDAVVVGAGFAGLYMLHRLRSLGFSTRVFEAGRGVGGTWHWNRYPGARCDVESMEYSYQFSPELQQEWEWTERYAAQPEILAYLNHVADRFDLRGDIQLDTTVSAARFDEEAGRWAIQTESGDFRAHFFILATGCLSSTNLPDFEGRDSFRGARYHTGRWPHDGVDFAGQHVGVIGTGSSAIQSIPMIAREARHLTVFQRTPNYSVPAHNRPLDPNFRDGVKADYAGLRERASQMPFGLDTQPRTELAAEATPEALAAEFETRWRHGGLQFMGAFADLLLDDNANQTAAKFLRGKIHDSVDDPAVAELLSPGTVVGCKRLCVDSDYYASFNRPNVTLVDIHQSPIERITPSGLRVNGHDHELDAIVFATGFDAMTGSILRIDVGGPRIYASTTSAASKPLRAPKTPGSST